MSVMGVAMYLGADAMMRLMTPVEAISQLGADVLRIEAWAEPMYAASIVAYGAFVGVGDTLYPGVHEFRQHMARAHTARRHSCSCHGPARRVDSHVRRAYIPRSHLLSAHALGTLAAPRP